MRLEMNWPYVVAVLIVSSGALGFVGWVITAPAFAAWRRGEPLPADWMWATVALFDGAIVAALFALFWKAYADSRTTVTNDELRRPAIFGPQILRWTSVQSVRFVHFGAHVVGSEGKIVVRPYSYRNPRDVVHFIIDRTRHAAIDGSEAT